MKTKGEHNYFDKVEFEHNGKSYMRQPCLTYGRVMGYFSAYQTNFNAGKKSEWNSRTFFTQEATENSKFCKQFS